MSHFEYFDAVAAARDFGTPLYVYSADGIRAHYRRLAQAFRATGIDFRLHYAVKANMNQEILKLLRHEGAGADCASPGELLAAHRAGFRAPDISYTGNYESSTDLEAAYKGAAFLNLDSREAFGRLQRFAVPERVGFRVNPGLGRGAFEQINTGGERSKFGVPFEDAELAYRSARDAGVKRFGLHTMPGSCVLEAEHFARSLRALFEGVGPVLQKLGIPLDYVDMGGGFGVPYRNEEAELNVELAARLAVEALREECARYGLGTPRLLAEPGRYLVASSGAVLAQVVSIKRSAGRRFVGLDAGMTTLLRPALYGAFHRLVVLGPDGHPRKFHADDLEASDLCGPICESSDFFARDQLLPKSLREGDLVLLCDAGAYGYSMSSAYNGRPRPAEALIERSALRLIRPRQKLEDLV